MNDLEHKAGLEATPKPATTNGESTVAGGEAGAVGSWLDGLVRVMRLPKSEAEEIREELESHIRERVRDLMLIGESEPRAIHHAISELGDAALLAQRYKQARKSSHRRWIMTAATFAIASGALVLSTMTLSGSPMLPGGDSQTSQVAPLTNAPADDELIHRVLETRVSLTDEVSYGEFFKLIMAHAGGGIVDGSTFEDIEDDLMDVTADDVTIGTVLDLVNRRHGYDEIVLHPNDGVVEITYQRIVDQIESRLVAYDIEHIVDQGVSSAEITDLIVDFVEPNDWVENGGRLADSQVVGHRLFVQAPPRFMPRIEWMLEQLSGPEQDAKNSAKLVERGQ